MALGLTSVDFVKQDQVLALLERTTYDVIVIDEARHCADPGAAADGDESQRRRLADVLARVARRDRYMGQRLLNADPPCTVVVLGAHDLAARAATVERLRSES